MTANAAVCQFRHQVKRWVKRQMWPRATGKRDEILQEVVDYLDGTARRASRKKGGLGRK